MIIHSPTPATHENVTRPVAQSVINYLIQILGMDPKIQVNYADLAEEVAQPGSTITPVAQGNPANFFTGDQKIFIEVSEAADETRAMSTKVLGKEAPPVFNDNRIKVSVWPIYTHTEMVISFKYRAVSRTQANQWRDDIRLRYNQGRVENIHTIDYHYGIPYQFLEILSAINVMKEAVAGYGESFGQWIMNHGTPRLTSASTLAGTQPQMVVSETQEAAIGWFDFEMEPQPLSKEDDTGPCVVSFEYHLAYDKPVQCGMEYPVMIHNQIIDVKYRDGYNKPATLGQRGRYTSFSRSRMDRFTRGMYQGLYSSMPWLRVPSFDDWVPLYTSDVTANVMTFLLQVDPQDPYYLLHLQDLGGYTIDPDVLNFMIGEGPFINSYRQSVFYMALYDDLGPAMENAISYKPDLQLRSEKALDMRTTYHLRWAAMTDLTMLSKPAQQRLCQNGPAALKILASLAGDEMARIPLPKLTNNALSREQLLEYGNLLNTRRRAGARVMTDAQPRRTVATYIVSAENNQTTQRG
jgi:hypothetical protein